MTKKREIKKDEIVKRPPVVVVLGHVDHGKSSLLEAIRDFKITAKESGGITQHIGAYELEHPSTTSGQAKKITFIDTPGHEAFSAMRQRGASVADIALLVIDAAQKVQPQTKEAIEAIKKAGIPTIVVLNKIDLPTADPEKIKRELMKEDVVVESMGGEVPSVNVSAREKQGIDELLEMILLVADMQDLKSDLKANPEGLIIESHMDKLKGPVATLIVEKGALKEQEIIATDSAFAKVKTLMDFEGSKTKKALPGQPAVVLGFQNLPAVGEKFQAYKNIQEAQKHTTLTAKKRVSKVLKEAEGKKILNIILKVDFQGSLEAIESMLSELPQEQVVLRIVKSEVGDINESDVKLAKTVNAQIIGFRVKINTGVAAIMKSDREKRVKIKNFDVIYELVQEIRAGMEKSLEAEIVKKETGKIKALVIFRTEKNRQIVGGKITDGEIKKGDKLEVFREDPSTGSEQVKKIGKGKIISLQRDKKETAILKKGSECGILFEGNVKVQEGDILVAFVEERVKGEL